ncbi:MAG: transporter [Novosphingobium sp. 28-62-57]|uniref:efflux RND transporter permease subunit n=1 Tax=unclassified Novosphingobium TaxID=2644732 RepID=UPI000BC5BE21|nr:MULTISPECIES: efflux RND transporter permease subunit [unclassified Novosphingobium]OYW50170.1 MAG: transporter [Novosphingobium sp. 12-62-10]OYZ11725.1 MAG: transporter [Novosphingobium sp. 28-62-57]
MNFQNISAWCIRNPVVPIVLFIGLTLAGLVSFMQMKVQDTPDIEFPVVIVQISQPGAAPTEIENQITQRVESAVRSIAGVDTLTSTASEGSSQTQVQFKIGQDINAAVNEVKNQVDQIRSDLPEGILEPQVFKVETSSNPIAYFAVAADDMTLEQLSWFIDDTIAKRLLTVPGMAEVSRSGGVNREIAVTLDPAKMNAMGVTASQVNAALRQVNINAAGGRTEVAGSRQSVRVLGNAKSAFDLSQTEIQITGNRTVRLSDVADVRDAYSELTSVAKFNGKPVVTFSMSRARGESDVSVYEGALEEMKKIEAEQGGKIHFELLFTSVTYTQDQYRSSMNAMVEGAVLAVIVVFFFLRDWRATIVSAIAIPLSSIPTFWVLDLMGFTLNQMSLLALGLVAGVLVDDAIVEIENIVRHMRMGKSAFQASIDAADEIGLAVVATTFSIVAVFFPVALMPGVSGQFFKNFGMTVVISVMFSLLVARMITPMVAAYFLKAHGEADHGGGPWMDKYMKVLSWSLDTSKAKAYRAQHPRRRFLARLHDHRLWMMGVGFLALLMTLAMFFVIPSQFFPDTDSDESTVTIEMVPGTTLQQTERKVAEIVALIGSQKEVESQLASVREAKANIYVNLRKDRERTSLVFERELTPQLQKISDVRVNFQAQGPGGPGGGSGRPISIMLAGSNPELLQNTAQTLVDQMSTLPSVVAPRISADLRRPEVIIKPRLDLAANLGITTQALSQVIRIATQGEIDQNSAKFSLSDRQVPIRVKLPEESRRDLSVIENLPVPTAGGGSVPLSRVAEIGFGSGPTQIQRYNQSRRVFVGADLQPGVVKGDAMAAIMKLPIMKNLPQGVSNTAAGEDKFQQEMLDNFVIAVAAGILLVFSVLVLLYRRFISPLVNMGSLFLAPLGGLIAIWIVGQSLSLPVFIGILMLFGIVAKNSILLIDFAIEEMATGKAKLEAITEAGHKRAQPIIMTTVAMVAGMIPTAVSIGGDGGWRAPMGIVVIGGLTLSTALTLLIVPAGFSLADGLEKRIGPWLARHVLGHEPDPVIDPAPAGAHHGPAHAAPIAARRNEPEHEAFPAE